MNVVKIFLLLNMLISLASCASVSREQELQANASIEWNNGIDEAVWISPSGEHLAFIYQGVMQKELIIYLRTVNPEVSACVFYSGESNPWAKLVICPNQEVRLYQRGDVVNVGILIAPLVNY